MTAKKLTLSQNLAQQQRLLVSQSLLEVPVLLVEQTLQKLLQDPAAFESKISQMVGEIGQKSVMFYHDNPSFHANLLMMICADFKTF